MINGRTADTWVEWLGRMHWELVATGTWEYPISPPTTVRTVETWLSPLPGAFAAVGLQRGPTSGTHHVHMMVGGVNALAATLLRRSWVKRGHILVARFDARRAAIRYLVDQADEIEIIGDPQWFIPRRKRSRNPGRRLLTEGNDRGAADS